MVKVAWKNKANSGGVLYLPLVVPHCTSIKLDEDARVLFTGPLSGCYVKIFDDLKAPSVTNCNKQGTAPSSQYHSQKMVSPGIQLHGEVVYNHAPF